MRQIFTLTFSKIEFKKWKNTKIRLVYNIQGANLNWNTFLHSLPVMLNNFSKGDKLDQDKL